MARNTPRNPEELAKIEASVIPAQGQETKETKPEVGFKEFLNLKSTTIAKAHLFAELKKRIEIDKATFNVVPFSVWVLAGTTSKDALGKNHAYAKFNYPQRFTFCLFDANGDLRQTEIDLSENPTLLKEMQESKINPNIWIKEKLIEAGYEDETVHTMTEFNPTQLPLEKLIDQVKDAAEKVDQLPPLN